MKALNRKEQKSVLLWGSVWIFLLAALLHFGYSSTAFFPLSFICAVNESTWEHIKIMVFGSLFYNLYLYLRFFRGNSSFITGLTPALLSIIISVPAMFYAYTKMTGKDIFFLDLLIAYLSGLFCQLILVGFTRSGRDFNKFQIPSIMIIILLIFTFFLFTWYPPNIKLFLPSENL